MTPRRFLLIRGALWRLLVLLIAAPLCLAQEPGQPKAVRLLTVGNSFSHNATHYLGELAKATGDTLILREANVGGASLELHWSKVEAFEKSPDDKEGRYGDGKSLKEELTSEPWNFVTFQQASIKSHDLATYRPYAKELSDYIRRYAPGATLLMHETWEYRVDDPRFSSQSAALVPLASQEEMYRGLASAYATVAKELNVRLIPVGDAFHLANHDAQWGFHASSTPFDAKNAKPGELPDQTHSLNVGWSWKKQPDATMKLTMDGHHANMAGEYLGACVWYEVLFGKSVENNSFVPAGFDPGYAKFLRVTAHQVVTKPVGSN